MKEEKRNRLNEKLVVNFPEFENSKRKLKLTLGANLKGEWK